MAMHTELMSHMKKVAEDDATQRAAAVESEQQWRMELEAALLAQPQRPWAEDGEAALRGDLEDARPGDPRTAAHAEPQRREIPRRDGASEQSLRRAESVRRADSQELAQQVPNPGDAAEQQLLADMRSALDGLSDGDAEEDALRPTNNSQLPGGGDAAIDGMEETGKAYAKASKEGQSDLGAPHLHVW